MASRAKYFMKQFGLTSEQMMSSPFEASSSLHTSSVGYNLQVCEERNESPIYEVLGWGLTPGLRMTEDDDEYMSFEKTVRYAGHVFSFHTTLTKTTGSLYTAWLMDGRAKKADGSLKGTPEDVHLFLWAMHEWLSVVYTTLTHVGSHVRMIRYSGDTDDKARLRIFEHIAKWIASQVSGMYRIIPGDEQTHFGVGGNYSKYERGPKL